MLRTLEDRQAGIYALAIAAGILAGLFFPAAGRSLEASIEPALAVLLYGMFSQIPFLRFRGALSNGRFAAALLGLNFVLVPALVWGLTRFLPDSEPLLLGVMLVLLTPCVDYVVAFTRLGKGDAALMLASTPLLLIVQMLLLPVYLGLFLGRDAAGVMSAWPFVRAFVLLIVVPLTLAVLTQHRARNLPAAERWLCLTAWIPVPAMALVLFVIPASQAGRIQEHVQVIIYAVPVYVAYVFASLLAGRAVAWLLRLGVRDSRALVFSGLTRNSLVVLPLALALPEGLRYTVAAVVVTQTIVELAAELVFIRLVPSLVLPGTRENDPA